MNCLPKNTVSYNKNDISRNVANFPAKFQCSRILLQICYQFTVIATYDNPNMAEMPC